LKKKYTVSKFDMSLASMKLPTNTRRLLREKVYEHRGQWPEGLGDSASPKQWALWRKTQEEEITAQMIMDAWDANPMARGWYRLMPADREHYSRKESAIGTDAAMKRFIERLYDYGYDCLDWVHIFPGRNFHKEGLHDLGKNELRQKSVLVLGTLSGNAWASIQLTFNKPFSQITIQDLLHTKEFRNHEMTSSVYSPRWHKSYDRTVRKLRSLGFTGAYPFMPEGYEQDKADLMRSLSHKYKIDAMTAEAVVYIAENEEWPLKHLLKT